MKLFFLLPSNVNHSEISLGLLRRTHFIYFIYMYLVELYLKLLEKPSKYILIIVRVTCVIVKVTSVWDIDNIMKGMQDLIVSIVKPFLSFRSIMIVVIFNICLFICNSTESRSMHLSNVFQTNTIKKLNVRWWQLPYVVVILYNVE